MKKDEKLKNIELSQMSIAHAIRNPLMAAGGFMRRTRDLLDPKTRAGEYAKIAVEEIERIENLVKNTLSYAKLDKLTLKESDLNTIIWKVIVEKQRELNQKNIPVEIFFIKDVIPRLILDEPKIKIALSYLIQNAIDAIGNKKEKIFIKTVRKKDKVRLEVKNTGSLIPDSERELIFTPFYTNRQKRWGLGLPIVQKIVESHNGRINVKSKKGPKKETMFVIKLPIN